MGQSFKVQDDTPPLDTDATEEVAAGASWGGGSGAAAWSPGGSLLLSDCCTPSPGPAPGPLPSASEMKLLLHTMQGSVLGLAPNQGLRASQAQPPPERDPWPGQGV